MKKSKFTEEQIAFALRQAESGTRVAEVCRKMDIRADLFPMEEEVRGARRLGASSVQATRGGEPPAQAPGGGPDARQADVAGCALKVILKPAHMRERVGYLEEAYWVSERRACRVIQICRSSHRYRS